MALGSLTTDKLLGGRVTLIQPEHGYRTAIDPILLAAAVPARSGNEILEVGSGTGAASFCLAARVPDIQITGLELQSTFVDLANESARLNGKNQNIIFFYGDLLFPPCTLPSYQFDHVMANPPYFMRGQRISSPNPQKEKAYVEGEAVLADWIYFALAKVRDGGSVTLVHLYDRREEVITGLAKGAGKISIFPIWPKMRGHGSKRVIIQGRKGQKGSTVLANGLVLHDSQGNFTKQASKILSDAGELNL